MRLDPEGFVQYCMKCLVQIYGAYHCACTGGAADWAQPGAGELGVPGHGCQDRQAHLVARCALTLNLEPDPHP